MRLVTLLALVLVLGCDQGSPTPASPVSPPITNTAPRPEVSHAPFAVTNRLVGEDGKVIRTIAASEYAEATPAGPHRFIVGELSVDTAAGTVAPVHKPFEFKETGEDRSRLVRFDPEGHERWAVALAGVRTVRPPDVAIGGGMVVATVNSTLSAFDDATGKQVWTLPTWASRLAIAGDAVFSVRCNEPTHDHWLIGYRLADGTEKFRAPLVDSCDPMMTVAPPNDWLVVVEDHRHEETRIFDTAGTLVARFDEQIEGDHETYGRMFAIGADALVITDKHVMRLARSGHVVWTIGPPANTFVGANDVVTLPNGDLVIANYTGISDDGVDVMRIRASDGTMIWRTAVPGLGVSHSKYRQLVYIEVRGENLFLVSQASGGNFMEELALGNGSRLRRFSL